MEKVRNGLLIAARIISPLLLLTFIIGLRPIESRGVESGPSLPLSASGPVLYYQFGPVAVSATGSQSVGLYLKTDGSPTSAKIVLASGAPDLTMTPLGGGAFSITLTHSQALYGYTASDYNHNFVGYLDLYEGATKLARYNLHINVLDSRIPHVVSQITDVEVKQSPHVVNLYLPGLYPANMDVAYVTQHFYQHFSDVYDFINVIFIPEHFENRYHIVVKNSVQGIGLSIFDNTATYGSTTHKLQGITVYPITGYFDLAERSSVHELGHQWINYLSVPQLQGVTPHWPISSLARGIMGWQGSGIQGLDFPYQLVPIGDGNYRCNYVGNKLDFNDMELYLMGLQPSSSVGSHFVFTNQSQTCDDGILYGPTETVTVEDVINQHGLRMPAYPFAQKKFRVATIVVTQSFLSDQEMDFFDYFAARGSFMVPVPFTSGFASGITWPFYVATGGRGCLVTTINTSGGCYAIYLPLVTRLAE